MKICRYCISNVERIWIDDYFYLKCDCMKLNEFIKNNLQLSFHHVEKKYHFHPFMCYSDHIKEGPKITAIDTNTCLTCYQYIETLLNNNCHTIYCAIDFPKNRILQSDFICIYIINEGRVATVLLPYDSNTGIKFKPLYKTHANKVMLSQYESVIAQIRQQKKKKSINT